MKAQFTENVQMIVHDSESYDTATIFINLYCRFTAYSNQYMKSIYYTIPLYNAIHRINDALWLVLNIYSSSLFT